MSIAQCDSELKDRIVKALLGQPLVNNAFRGTLVEAILAGALQPDWRWCADGWGSYDFEGPGGIGLEVKQSTARQDWHIEGSTPNRGRFDIAARKGRWEGERWEDKPGRFAAIYIFAWHPVFDPAQADHREAKQWQFHIVPAVLLPDQKSLGLSGVKALAEPMGIDQVKEGLAASLSKLR